MGRLTRLSRRIRHWIRRHGQRRRAIPLLAGLSAATVFGSVFVGKLCWFALLMGLLLHAPRWLQQLPWLGPYLDAMSKNAMRNTGVNTP